MTQHTHNHDYRPGYTYLESEPPDYLKTANGNVEDAHTAYINLIDDEAAKDLIDHAWGKVVECEQTARDAYVQWQQETCPHTNTFPVVIGEQRMSQGEPDDGTEQIEICAACYAPVPVKDIG